MNGIIQKFGGKFRVVNFDVLLQYELHREGRQNYWADVPMSMIGELPIGTIYKKNSEEYFSIKGIGINRIIFQKLYDTNIVFTDMDDLPEVGRFLIADNYGQTHVAKSRAFFYLNWNIENLINNNLLLCILVVAYCVSALSIYYYFAYMLFIVFSVAGFTVLQFYLLDSNVVPQSMCGKSSKCLNVFLLNPFRLNALHPYVIGSTTLLFVSLSPVFSTEAASFFLMALAIVVLPYILWSHLFESEGICRICLLVTIFFALSAASILIVNWKIYSFDDINFIRSAVLFCLFLFIFNIAYRNKSIRDQQLSNTALLKWFQSNRAIFSLIMQSSSSSNIDLDDYDYAIIGSLDATKVIDILISLRCRHCFALIEEYVNKFANHEHVSLRIRIVNMNDMSCIEQQFIEDFYFGELTDKYRLLQVYFGGSYNNTVDLPSDSRKPTLLTNYKYVPRVLIGNKDLPKVFDTDDLVYHLSNNASDV